MAQAELVKTEAVRLDALDKVTGAARYAADIVRPGQLIGKVLRSPLPHARIVAIETAAARALPGVHTVLTGLDLPDVRVGRAMRDMPVLAREKVRFIGEKVVAVAAESAEIAEEALGLITVEYEELPAVYDPLEAIRPGLLIHEPDWVRTHTAPKQVVPDYPNGVSVPSWGATRAEVEAALAQASRVFEHTFHTQVQHQAYLEPHSCMVELDQHGVAHIWASNKAPFLLLNYLRAGLGLTREQLEMHLLPLGGDFGGKGSFMDIPLAYFLAKETGRPVRMSMSYVDELTAGNPRHSATVYVASGVDESGRVTARWMRVYFNSGAYAAFKPALDATLPSIQFGGFGAYGVPVSRLEAHMIYTNTVPRGHMRGPGEIQTAYALECHTDLVARAIGMDPVEFRVLNAARERRATLGGAHLPPPRVREVLEAAASAIGWHEPRPEGVGRGLALLEYTTIPGVYSARLSITRQGEVIFQTPIIENGVGSHTAFRTIVAEALGISDEAVIVRQGMEGIENDRGVGGARITRLVGKIIEVLTVRVQDRLRDLLAAEFGLEAASVEPTPGGFRDTSGRTYTLADAAALLPEDLVETYLLEATGQDDATVFLAQAAEVKIDPETGAIRPLRLVTAHEVGRVVQPLLHERQIEGGMIQGLGYALMEEEVIQDGRVVNPNFHEYKIPTAADIPRCETILLEPDLSLGITPVGEGPMMGIAPAIANAVAEVVGPQPLEVPLHAETIRRLWAERRRTSSTSTSAPVN